MSKALFNTPRRFGWISIAIHWLSALMIIGLFILGLYMVELDYYDPFYHDSFVWHESLGILFAVILLVRIIWHRISKKPEPIGDNTNLQRIAKLVHWAMLALLFAIVITGYLMTTADGHSVKVFDWFEIPSLTGKVNQLETLLGQLHYIFAIAVIGLASIHSLAAIKHQLIDKDGGLVRIIKVIPDTNSNEKK